MKEQERILVVDDDTMNLKVVEYILKKQFEISFAKSGEECLSFLQETIPDMILLDVNMPEMSGFEVMEKIRSEERYKDIPVIFLTADDDKDTEVRGFQVGALDFITKPFISEIVQQRVTRLMEFSRLQKHLEREVKRQTAKAEERRQRIEQMSLQAVQTLAKAIDAKDTYTNGHSYRVAEYSVLLARELGWKEEDVENLRQAALLHDIGKIGIPDSVLNKPSKLTDEEYNVIKSHADKGREILQCITAIPDANLIAGHHHERYDGSGYPDGLKGEEIPESARIVAVADAYDAMNSKRIYRKNLKKDVIRQELVNGKNKQFDPRATDAFIRMMDEGRLVIRENDEDGDGRPENDKEDVSSQLLQKVVETMSNQNSTEGRDFLTGLPLRNLGEVQIAEAMQEDNGCLAFIDVDNLKKINDTIGHKAGDRLLKMVGHLLQEDSPNNIICRLGGDEFLLFMSGMSKETAGEHIKKMIERFEQKKNEDASVRQASLSVGLCMTTPLDNYSDVYNKADKALYYVKQNGKAGYSFYEKGDEMKQNHVSADLMQVMDVLKTNGDYSGAMNVEYREFSRMFEYISNLQKRYAHDFHLLMITLENQMGDRLYIEELEETMSYMEMAINETIRTVDVCTRYSSMQYLVILFEAGETNVKTIADRIFYNFFKRCENRKIKPTYVSLRSTIE